MGCVGQGRKIQLTEPEYTFLYSPNIIKACQEMSRGIVSDIFEMEVSTFELELTLFYVNRKIIFWPSRLI